MITFLSGTVILKTERYVVVEVAGVGYRVFASPETLRNIPERGSAVKLWTRHYVREDTHELYGFRQPAELDLFEILIQVPSVGPKTALGVMGVAPLDTLRRAIAAGDTSYLTKVSGIGRKTAEKIVIELKEKFAGRGVRVEAPELKEDLDAQDALVALGYTAREAREALNQLPQTLTTAQDRVRAALKKLGNASR